MQHFNPRARAGRGGGSIFSDTNNGDFNPRARAGRGDNVLSMIFDDSISIHAPVRGAALKPTKIRCRLCIIITKRRLFFNSKTH